MSLPDACCYFELLVTDGHSVGVQSGGTTSCLHLLKGVSFPHGQNVLRYISLQGTWGTARKKGTGNTMVPSLRAFLVTLYLIRIHSPPLPRSPLMLWTKSLQHSVLTLPFVILFNVLQLHWCFKVVLFGAWPVSFKTVLSLISVFEDWD